LLVRWDYVARPPGDAHQCLVLGDKRKGYRHLPGSRGQRVSAAYLGILSTVHDDESGGRVESRRVALITGAAQGIGRCIAQTLGARGYALALNDVRVPTATLAFLRSAGCESMELVGDITDERMIETGVGQIMSRWGRLDVLVNNAGVSCIRRAQDTNAEQFRRVLDVNLLGAFIVARAAGSVMLEQRSGSII